MSSHHNKNSQNFENVEDFQTNFNTNVNNNFNNRNSNNRESNLDFYDNKYYDMYKKHR